MSAEPTKSQGVQLKMGGTLVGGVLDVSGPDETVEVIDVTSVDDTDRQSITDVKEGGTINVSMNYISNNAQQNTLLQAFGDGTNYAFIIEFNDTLGAANSQVSFSGKVTGRSISYGVGRQPTCTVSLKVDGAVTYTQAS